MVSWTHQIAKGFGSRNVQLHFNLIGYDPLTYMLEFKYSRSKYCF